MCLRTFSVVNPTKVFARNLSQRFFLDVPCGQCPECRSLSRSQWFLRTYNHLQETIEAGGFAYFETLSYDDDHLPRLSKFYDFIKPGSELDFACFDKRDLRLFLVNLRRQLSYYGYRNGKEKLISYIICSEYGDDNEYIDDRGRFRVGTKRPHYHPIFFVLPDKSGDLKLGPSELSFFVNKCWQKGRTDGYMWHPEDPNYIYSHSTLGKEFCSDDNSYRRVTSYVSKYVLKSSDYSVKSLSRIYAFMQESYRLGNDDPDLSLRLQDSYRDISCRFKEFHIQSQGFGLFAVKNLSDEELERIIVTGKIKVPDSKLVSKEINIPLYYQHYLFYDKVKTDKGILYRLNSRGIIFKAYRFNEAVIHLAEKMYNTYINASDDQRYKFDSLMKGRTWNDYAVYILGYRGRIMSQKALFNHCKDDLSEVFFNSLPTIQHDVITSSDLFVYNYSRAADVPNFKERFVTERYLGNVADNNFIDNGTVFSNFFDSSVANLKRLCPDTFIKSAFDFSNLYCYNQNSDDSFASFDDVLRFYNDISEDITIEKELAYEKKVYLTDILKRFGYIISKPVI